MALIYATGAELQSFASNMEIESVYGTTSIETTVVRSGSASWEISGPIAPTGASGFVQSFGGLAKCYVQTGFYIDHLPDNLSVTLFADLAGATGSMITCNVVRESGDIKIYVYVNNYTVTLGPFTVSEDAWHTLEYEYDSTPANGSEICTVRIDGVQVGQLTNLNYADKTVTSFGAGVYNGTGSTTSDYIVYVDDVVINDSTGSYMNSWPDGVKLKHLHPDGNGDNRQWNDDGSASQGTSLYTNVNEVTPNDATNYNKRTNTTPNTNPIDDWTVETSGLNSYDIVDFVAIGIRAGATSATATNRSIVTRIKSASGGTTTSSSSTDISVNGWITHRDAAPGLYQLISYLDPTSGVAWTTTGTNSLENMQIGYQANAASSAEIRVSTIWALVGYKVGTPPSGGGVKVKVSGSFIEGLAKVKVSGSFVDAVVKVKVSGSFVETS